MTERALSGDIDNQTIDELKRLSVVGVSTLYNVAEKNLKVVSQEKVDDFYELKLKSDSTVFSVYCTEENVVGRIRCTKNNLSAHGADGSGCVAIYSTAYHDLFDVDTINDAKLMKRRIRDKVKKIKTERIYLSIY